MAEKLLKSANEVTEQEFKAFIAVRDSGRTNMWDGLAVQRLSRGVVDRATHYAIIKYWHEIAERFPNADKRK